MPSVSSFGEEPPLTPISIEGKWGYIDSSGKVVIEPKFLKARYFCEGLAVVNVAGTSEHDYAYELTYDGFIGLDGEFVIPPQPPQAVREMERYNSYFYSDFHDGLARIHINDGTGMDGYIDRQGQLAIYPEFDTTSDFSEGLAFVETWRPWDQPGPKRKGFINQRGEFEIENDAFKSSQGFRGGRAKVTLGSWEKDEEKHGLIDTQGKFVIWPDVYDDLSDPEDGVVSAYKNEESALLDLDGNVLIPFGKFDFISHVSSGLFFAGKNGQRFLIDATGKVQAVIATEGYIQDFHEGLALIQQDRRWGYINELGKLQIAMKFVGAESFRFGLAYVNLGDTRGYINRQGDLVWQTDCWEEPLRYSVSEPVSTFLPESTIEALPFSRNWGGVQNAIVFAAEGSPQSLLAWYRKRCTGNINLSDYSDFEDEPEKLTLLIQSKPDGFSLEAYAFDGNHEHADDFVAYYCCENMQALRKKYPTKLIGILIDISLRK